MQYTINSPGDLDSEPSSSSFTPVPDLKAIGAVCYNTELGNEGVSTMLHTMLPHHRMKTCELTSNKLRSLSNRLSTKRFTFVIAFCKSILDKRLVELATQFSCTEMIYIVHIQRCALLDRCHMMLDMNYDVGHELNYLPGEATDRTPCTRMLMLQRYS